jgi:integrase
MAGSRRTPGEGGAYAYQKRDGRELWYFKCTVTLADGTKKVKVKRGYITKTRALAAMREALGASDKGAYFEPSKITVAQWAATWLDTAGLWPESRATYERVLTWYVLPHIGKVELAKLTSSMITKWLQELVASGGKGGRPLSAKTAYLARGTLSTMVTFAIEHHEPPLLQRNPCAKAVLPERLTPDDGDDDDGDLKAWDEAQLAVFLAWSAEHDAKWADYYHVAAWSGARRMELMHLRWRDVDDTGIMLRITKGGKRRKPRRVALDADTLAVLRRRKVARGTLNLALVRPSGYVFGGADGRLIPPPKATVAFRSAVRRARRTLGEDELPEITLHGLRHTHACIWLVNGKPVHTLSRRLGHASPVITLGVYSHVLPGEQDRYAQEVADQVKSKIKKISITGPVSDAADGV